MFNRNDLVQFKKKGISPKEVERQLECFRKGFPPMKIVRPATIGDGIRKLDLAGIAECVAVYERKLSMKISLLKFVPASGAATRMFKELFDMKDKLKAGMKVDEIFLDKRMAAAKTFFENIRKFAFFEDLQKLSAMRGMGIETLLAGRDYLPILEFLLDPEGLNYGNLPKGLLQFHKYSEGRRTPVEEHLVKGALYARNSDGTVRLHFTVSSSHKKGFKELIANAGKIIARKLGVRYKVDYSEQHSSTDTIAVDMNNEPFREKDGSILFRPGGHGALLANLNKINADCIFVKNIDNVAHEKLVETTVAYKKALAGMMFALQEKIFGYLKKLAKDGATFLLVDEIVKFYKMELFTEFGSTFDALSFEKKTAYLRAKLDRPVRVCGMVKAEGDKGGGPFFAVNPDGSISLQVVESAQIDMNDPAAKKIFDSSTHFSPADFALGVRSYKGKKFDLMKYSDPATGFISIKSKDGQDLKAQELPGLWNGAMSDWNTLCMEVPAETFNPVKSVVDLLKNAHQ